MEYSRLDASIQLREGLPVSDSYLIAVLGALLLPSIWSAGFSLMVLRLGEPARAATWPVYVARIRMLNLLAVPAPKPLPDWMPPLIREEDAPMFFKAGYLIKPFAQ